MAKAVTSVVLNAALSYIKHYCNRMFVCSQQPSTVAMASNTEMLASVAIVSGNIVLADGDVSGRKITVSAFASVNISASGSAQHIVLCDCSAATSIVLLCTTCTSQALTVGNTLTIPAWDYEIEDPS
jgi:hypothetical protein